MEDNNLFRKEALEAQKVNWFGEILVSQPISFNILVSMSMVIGVIVISFIFWGEYTKKTTSLGQIYPVIGVSKIYANYNGIVDKKLVNEGDFVEEGDILYEISTNKFSGENDLYQLIGNQIKLKEGNLKIEKDKQSSIYELKITSQRQSESKLKLELSNTNILIENQKKKIELVKKNLERYKILGNDNAVSKEELGEKELVYLESVNQLKELELNKLEIVKQIQDVIKTIEIYQNEKNIAILSIEHELNSNKKELIQNEGSQKYSIKAKVSGVVTAVNAEEGKTVDMAKPLLTILPNTTKFEARLYVPSQSIGFIKIGDKTLMRYQAFPYQKFGHGVGYVKSISKTALNISDIDDLGLTASVQSLTTEPVYLVKVTLDKDFVTTYGEKTLIKTGMTLEADILHEKRKLYEWILEPLFSITGKL